MIVGVNSLGLDWSQCVRPDTAVPGYQSLDNSISAALLPIYCCKYETGIFP